MRQIWLRSLNVRLVAACLLMTGCNPELDPLLPAGEGGPASTAGLTLVARVAHVSDTHIVDESSPARFTKAHAFTKSAWRPYERYSTQILDGIIRTANRVHASPRGIDFLVHTGDCVDNAQSNELTWLIGLFDGGVIDPRSGPDDRPVDERPPVELDPHAPFTAQGLYRHGVLGDQPSVPWYVVYGNHDVRAIGLFPIVEDEAGGRIAPLPLPGRPGVLFPSVFVPEGAFSYGLVTPAIPGPPGLLELPAEIEPVADRAYFSRNEFIAAMFGTVTGPAGHGFADATDGASWYSTSPVAGVRLIGLDTTDTGWAVPGLFYSEGSIAAAQRDWLRAELSAAEARGEIVIVASHHPSEALRLDYGSVLDPSGLRDLLREFPSVVLHLCGHRHRNRVVDRGSYLEIETCSTLDLPQEGRLIEIWRDEANDSIAIGYEMFSHIEDDLPPLGEDPLRAMRVEARTIAEGDKRATARQLRIDPSGADPVGRAEDREGFILLGR